MREGGKRAFDRQAAASEYRRDSLLPNLFSLYTLNCRDEKESVVCANKIFLSFNCASISNVSNDFSTGPSCVHNTLLAIVPASLFYETGLFIDKN